MTGFFCYGDSDNVIEYDCVPNSLCSRCGPGSRSSSGSPSSSSSSPWCLPWSGTSWATPGSRTSTRSLTSPWATPSAAGTCITEDKSSSGTHLCRDVNVQTYYCHCNSQNEIVTCSPNKIECQNVRKRIPAAGLITQLSLCEMWENKRSWHPNVSNGLKWSHQGRVSSGLKGVSEYISGAQSEWCVAVGMTYIFGKYFAINLIIQQWPSNVHQQSTGEPPALPWSVQEGLRWCLMSLEHLSASYHLTSN